MHACVHASVRVCVRACVRTHVRTYYVCDGCSKGPCLQFVQERQRDRVQRFRERSGKAGTKGKQICAKDVSTQHYKIQTCLACSCVKFLVRVMLVAAKMQRKYADAQQALKPVAFFSCVPDSL